MMRLRLDDGVQEAIDRRLRSWRDTGFVERLWQKDPTLWADPDTPEIADRLGWLDLPNSAISELGVWGEFADSIQTEGLQDVVLCGMGGSSLAPEVFQRTFGNSAGYPGLQVLDSTHPDAVRQLEQDVDLDRTLFLVSSKSGTTTETLSFFRYFWERIAQGSDDPGRQFLAITDAGTPLETLARQRGFRAIFNARPDVGGRFSALTAFGLVPALLIGVNVEELLQRAQAAAEASAPSISPNENEALQLGAALGELTRLGQDKLTFATSPSLSAFPDWLEQLVAESTGKDETGIVPVVCEPLGAPEVYTDDRVFVHLKLADEDDTVQEQRLSDLEIAGHPVIRIELSDRYDLSQEMFRWETAIAAAGVVLNIHPFNQPNVELAKQLAKEGMSQDDAESSDTEIESVNVANGNEAVSSIREWLDAANVRDYLALQAYVAPASRVNEALHEIRLKLRDQYNVATTLGYGPRFLHSTGQLHKGGANSGMFLQIVDEPDEALPVPGTDYSFQRLIRAQADGDYHALRQQGRRVLRINVASNALRGLERLRDALR